MKHETSTFQSGCAPFNDFFFFAKELDELAQQDTPNSSFFAFNEEDTPEPYMKYDESVGWPATAMATVKPGDANRLVVAIGPNGDYWEADPVSTEERVGKIAGFRGNLRALAVVGDDIYACGMGRVVLQRQSPGKWRSLGPSVREDDPDVVGFEDIGGNSDDDMYAVGWGGEIWRLDSDEWRRVDSPTTTSLSALAVAEDGIVYVVGHNGTMLRGRGDTWAAVGSGRTANLMDVACHGGEVYVATSTRILRLADDTLVDAAGFADPADLPGTCGCLLPTADGLVSMGEKDLFRYNSTSWQRLV